MAQINKSKFGDGDGMQCNLREKVLQIVMERNLCSYMNNTKWNELITAIEEKMPFPPPFEIKYLTENDFSNELQNEDVYYLGDWRGENFPSKEYYFNIEWLKVRPRYLKYCGKLIMPEIIDGSKMFETILNEYHIPYEERNGLYCIYGYC